MWDSSFRSLTVIKHKKKVCIVGEKSKDPKVTKLTYFPDLFFIFILVIFAM